MGGGEELSVPVGQLGGLSNTQLSKLMILRNINKLSVKTFKLNRIAYHQRQENLVMFKTFDSIVKLMSMYPTHPVHLQPCLYWLIPFSNYL